jgi:DNA excision repair protein ERCC-3
MPEKLIGKELRDYQIEAIEEFMKEKIALLEIGTGAGKTLIATECIRQLGCKTLFVVDKIELLRQTKKVLEDALGIEVGIIGGKEEDIKDITVATIQTLIKRIQKYRPYLATVSFCVMDECHKIAAKSYKKLSLYLPNTIYRLGISGTAFRDDGNDMAIMAVCGEKCYVLSADILIKNGWLMKPNIIFKEVKCEEIDDDYANSYNICIYANAERNKMITETVKENDGKRILILTKLIEHGKLLSDMSGGVHLYGATNKEERKEIMERFRGGDFNILVSTISIFSEGIDIPELDLVINASANKGDVKSIQVLGRVLRKNEGKEQAIYYDFLDVGNKFFKAASKARIKVFKKEGHEVDVK